MKLLINQLLYWHNNNEALSQIDRVLWLDASGTDVVTIDINSPKAQPIFHKYKELEAALAANRASILTDDPKRQILLPTDEISEAQRKYRDEAWSSIALIVSQGESAFYQSERSRLIKEAVRRTGRSEPTIRKDLRRYWQGGQTKNALLPRFENCGGKGKEKSAMGRKRGRPSLLSQSRGEPKGVNVNASIQEKFRKGIRLFYENRQGRPLTQAYQLTLEKFFHKGYKLEQGVLVPLLPPAEELPSFDQFKYWYEKSCDITQKLIAREGERGYHLRHRALGGNSTEMAIGPGSQFQIDATLADVYLVSGLNRSWIIGRPTLYLVIDVFSRLIVGFVVTLEPPSWLAAMLALENATVPKVEFCSRYGIEITESEWPSHHLPEVILADRGEFEGYNANNLIDCLGVDDIRNTSPYRADMKGLIERSFRWFNDEMIHWFPGCVKKLPERGDKDYRLDGVLTLDEFRQLMILCILDHNNQRRLDCYPMSEFMLCDELEPYPVNLWQWGVENRVGSLHWKPLEIVRLNLLPSEKASVTRDGSIYFKKLHYTCPTAMREQWFVQARNKGSWKIPVAYDPRRVDNIYLRLENGSRLEICHLLEVEQRFKGCDFREVEDYKRRQKVKQDVAKSRKQQSKASLNALVNQIVEKAIEETGKANQGQTHSSILQNLRQNREQERHTERQIQAWDLTPKKVSDPTEPVVPLITITQPEDDDEEYVAPHRPIDKLRQSRLNKLNNDTP